MQCVEPAAAPAVARVQEAAAPPLVPLDAGSGWDAGDDLDLSAQLTRQSLGSSAGPAEPRASGSDDDWGDFDTGPRQPRSQSTLDARLLSQSVYLLECLPGFTSESACIRAFCRISFFRCAYVQVWDRKSLPPQGGHRRLEEGGLAGGEQAGR